MRSTYLENLKIEVKEYFSILAKEIPEFLIEYIQTKEMQRIGKIGVYCGTDYTNIFNTEFFYSNLEHSIATALIIWNFTKDKKQTLAGLFHDIATPAFKHCIDFLHGDYETQESTEELTTKIIKESKEIRRLLQRDGIKLEEVEDYKIYPIADNKSPKLSADRLEYTLSGGIAFGKVWTIEQVRKIYEDITILKNEEDIQELGFNSKKRAEEFIIGASQLWPMWISNADKLTMQFIADIVRLMVENEYLKEEELYVLSEQEVIDTIENNSNTRIATAFKKFRESTIIGEGEVAVKDTYCVSIQSKRRYTNPLVKTTNGNKRVDSVSEQVKQQIEEYHHYQTPKYAYLDFKL